MNTNTPTRQSIIKDQTGQAMLEFAGSMVILVLLYLVIITVGLRIADLTAVNKAARDGGRQAAITGSVAAGEIKAAETAWAWGLEESRFSVEIDTSAYSAGNLLTCTARYDSAPFASLFPTMSGTQPVAAKELKGTAVFGWWDYEN